VRYYSIKLINGVTTFKCPRCKHSVTMLQFSGEKGSRRTQAARAMNEHAATVHACSRPTLPLYAPVWQAR
jgi:hypothetical protein